MYKLNSRPNSTTDHSVTQKALVRVRRAFGIMLLMGLTWAFGFGTASDLRLEFSYLFSIFNALQGFAIFIFYCLAQRNARNAWYRFVTCDSRSDLKRNTDSYYERRRMSSTASNRTNTLQFHRGGSNASSVSMNSANFSVVFYKVPVPKISQNFQENMPERVLVWQNSRPFARKSVHIFLKNALLTMLTESEVRLPLVLPICCS